MEGLGGGVLDDTCATQQHPDGVVVGGGVDDSDKYIRHNATIGEGLRSPSGTVIIDIAACDGPVFFERVVNRAYKANVSNSFASGHYIFCGFNYSVIINYIYCTSSRSDSMYKH